jgi:hypothetical protein
MSFHVASQEVDQQPTLQSEHFGAHKGWNSLSNAFLCARPSPFHAKPLILVSNVVRTLLIRIFGVLNELNPQQFCMTEGDINLRKFHFWSVLVQ